jgi:hypothetical protein
VARVLSGCKGKLDAVSHHGRCHMLWALGSADTGDGGAWGAVDAAGRVWVREYGHFGAYVHWEVRDLQLAAAHMGGVSARSC